jgi:hypothetical protein
MKTERPKNGQSNGAPPARSAPKPRRKKPVTTTSRDALFEELRKELGL